MSLRDNQINRLAATNLDVLVVGGGINGAVSAAALAACKVRVGLIDARDFAGFTSQHSSNLVWGGIKYLEDFELGLVNDLCVSRNELLHAFPATVKEIRFLTLLPQGFRHPRWLMLAGSWLYWLLGRGKTRPPRLLSKLDIKAMEPLLNTTGSVGGIEYSDAYLHDNDARFVFNFVRQALDHGGLAANYLALEQAQRSPQGTWTATVKDQVSGRCFDIRARAIVNATGPFVDQLNATNHIKTQYKHAFAKGIHLIVPRIARDQRVLASFAADGRLFFAIPMANRTCIGTTDTAIGSPLSVITDADRDEVLANINAMLDLQQPFQRQDIIAERCGVRPLVVSKDAKPGASAHLSRRHKLELSAPDYLSIFGGKLTDCLNVAREVCDTLRQSDINIKPLSADWYLQSGRSVRAEYFRRAHELGLDRMVASDTGERLQERLWRRYAHHALGMLDTIASDPHMAAPLIEGYGIRRCELEYLAKNEMIVTLEDYLRRRSKLEQVVPKHTLQQSPGLKQACTILFGDDAQARYDEYVASLPDCAQASEQIKTSPG